VCADKSHWDLVVKNSAYIDGLLAVLEVSWPVIVVAWCFARRGTGKVQDEAENCAPCASIRVVNFPEI